METEPERVETEEHGAVPFGVSSSFQLSAWDGLNECFFNTEATPERVAVSGSGAPSEEFFVASTSGYNWASAYNQWDTTGGRSDHMWPISFASGIAGIGDDTVTSSGFTGLNYIALAVDDGSPPAVLAVGAATSDGLSTGTFSAPVRPIYTGNADGAIDDTPWIEYDRGGTDLFAISRSDLRLHAAVMKNCQTGPVGCCVDATCTATCAATAFEPCPVTSNPAALTTDLQETTTMAINPCTHNAVIPFIQSSDATLRVIYLKADGTSRISNPIASNVFKGKNNTLSGRCSSDTESSASVRVCFDSSEWLWPF